MVSSGLTQYSVPHKHPEVGCCYQGTVAILVSWTTLDNLDKAVSNAS